MEQSWFLNLRGRRTWQRTGQCCERTLYRKTWMGRVETGKVRRHGTDMRVRLETGMGTGCSSK